MKKIIPFLVFVLVSFIGNSQHQISGKVVDQDQDPVAFATIFIEGTYLQTQANFDGNYVFSGLPNGKYRLITQFVGLKTETKEVIIQDKNIEINFLLSPLAYVSEEVIIEATRMEKDQNGAFDQVDKEEMEKNDFGQDLPYLLNQTPSVVVTSDAGAGVGYTGIRIRGSDATRINVTINGVPLNDPESHGVYWVDIPDISSSSENIQIQRGVGSSTHGTGAFGGSINLLTNTIKTKPYAKYSGAVGSFNTWKNSISFGSGLIENHWSFDGRITQISSDGYIDRASSDLKSYYLSAGYFSGKTLIKAMVFGGFERTYQAWEGVPIAKYNNDSLELAAHIYNNGYSDEALANLQNSSSDTYNPYTYKDQVDNYNQDHFQLHLSHNLNDNIKLTGALHYTYGRGYYETFKQEESLAEYSLTPIVTPSDSSDISDLIRRKWLSNDFYGFTGSIQYDKDKTNFIVGGAVNQYIGDHYGKVIWAQRSLIPSYDHTYYANTGTKNDANIFTKATYKINENIYVTGDLQLRFLDYKTHGIGENRQELKLDNNYTFFNPKFSINYRPNSNSEAFVYVGRANREPVRSDFIDSPLGTPLPEQLTDYELGYQNKGKKHNFQFTGYYMDYKNQLILTGALNDVGDPIHANAEKSFRKGIELVFGYQILSNFSWGINATFSKNKIQSYTQLMDDYTNGFEVIETKFENTDISYSPNMILGNTLEYSFLKHLNISLNSKFVDKQYLDNTTNDDKSLDAYFINDILVNFKKNLKNKSELTLGLKIGNIFNERYVSNGYTYSYKYIDVVTETFVFPQAGRNYMLKFGLSF